MATANTIRDKSGYKEIAAQLRSKIERGHWASGLMIPSRKSLTQEFQVGMGTIQSAISLLVSEGLLQTDDRRGTFVAQPGSAAVNSVGKRSAAPITNATIGILSRFGDAGNPDSISQVQEVWQHNILHSIERVLSEAQCLTQFVNYSPLQGNSVPVEQAIRSLLAQGVSALAAVFIHDTPDEVNEILRTVEASGVPVVFVSSNALHRPVPHVIYDNFYGGYAAAQHMIDRGYQDITFVAPPLGDWVDARVAGARQAFRDADIAGDRLRVVPAERTLFTDGRQYTPAGYEIGRSLFADGACVRAIISANDSISFGVLNAASEAGLVPGKDFGIISFDDDQQARHIGLTSLRPPLEEMGEAAARLVLSILSGQEMTTQVSLRAHLLARASTRRIDVSC